VDLVTDRNSLRKLLDFVSGHSRESWHIDVELVNETMFLTRFEKDEVRYITGSFFSGYGHEFEKAFLRFESGLENSSSHQRIIEYEIGGMKWVVRFEADGYFKANAENEVNAGLSVALDELSLESELEQQSTFLEGMNCIQKGHLVSPESIIEVKCTGGKSNQLSIKTPQCWFSQTGHYFVGRHSEGLVNKVNKTEMGPVFHSWENNHQENLRKLVTLIKEIKELAGSLDGGKCSLVHDYKEKPKVMRAFKSHHSRLALSPLVKERFWKNGAEDSEVEEDGGVKI